MKSKYMEYLYKTQQIFKESHCLIRVVYYILTVANNDLFLNAVKFRANYDCI